MGLVPIVEGCDRSPRASEVLRQIWQPQKSVKIDENPERSRENPEAPPFRLSSARDFRL